VNTNARSGSATNTQGTETKESDESGTMVRFWARVDCRGPLECWPWKGGRRSRTGRRNAGTYGGLWMNGRMVLAHRVALFGAEQRPEKALHTCDNPLCCNPTHLFAGSQLANVRDQLAKGRWKRTRGVDGRFKRMP